MSASRLRMVAQRAVANSMKVEFSKHAVSQMAERKIPEQWVVRALQEPDFVRDDKSHPDVKLAFRRIWRQMASCGL